jgi:type III restriction enzyme
LKQSESSIAKRQEVGRGLRLAINQNGDRQDIDVWGEQLVQDINKLTVIASESYASFVTDLQRGIAADLYDRPTVASVEYFTGKTIRVDGEVHQISVREATVAYHYLVKNDYVDDEGKITDIYRMANTNGSLAALPESIAPLAQGIHALVQHIYDPSALSDMIEPAKKAPVNNRFVDANWEAFLQLWERINKRYAYLVDFDSDELINQAVSSINANLSVTEVSYTRTTGEGFVQFSVSSEKTTSLPRSTAISVKYDIAQKISDAVNLSRKTVIAILQKLRPDRMMMFAANPEEFISKVSKIINECKAAIVVQAITYVRSGEPDYTREIFNMSRSSEEYQRAFKARKAIQQYIFTDGTSGEDSIERRFARALDIGEEVVVYAKLPKGPKGFFIPTPVGNYSPDWAISFKQGSVRYIYFIAETKGSMDRTQFRPIENAKIDCAMRLFNQFSSAGVRYHFVDSYRTLIADVMQRDL